MPPAYLPKKSIEARVLNNGFHVPGCSGRCVQVGGRSRVTSCTEDRAVKGRCKTNDIGKSYLLKSFFFFHLFTNCSMH